MQATQSPTNVKSTGRWHKASYSATSKECVEVCEGAVTGVRDTQNRELATLELPAHSWTALLAVL